MGLRGKPARGQEDWMVPVADLMVKEGMSFTSACMAQGKKFTTGQEEHEAKYSDVFQNILDALTFKFYARIGGNPLLTKDVLAGTLMTAVRRLGESEQWEKIAMPGKLLSDLMGWTKDSANVPVFANLTQREIDEIRAKLREEEDEPKQVQVVVLGSEAN